LGSHIQAARAKKVVDDKRMAALAAVRAAAKLQKAKNEQAKTYAVGDQVTALWHPDKTFAGSRYGETVREVRDNGTFLLDWADGDPQDCVKTAAEIRPADTER